MGHNFSSKEQASFNFMAAVTISSDFGAPKNKVGHCFHCFPIYLPWSDGPGAMILVLWMLSCKPTFSRIFPSHIIQMHQFFSAQPSLWSSSHISTWLLENQKTIALTRWTFVGKITSLFFNMLSRLFIAFLPRRKYLLISPSAVILEPPKRKSATVSTVSPSICHEVMGQVPWS